MFDHHPLTLPDYFPVRQLFVIIQHVLWLLHLRFGLSPLGFHHSIYDEICLLVVSLLLLHVLFDAF